jgi:hypothetical protein
MRGQHENRERTGRRITRLTELLVASCLLVVSLNATAQSPSNSAKRFEKDGLVFDYTANWELSDQSNAAAQQLVLTEKTLDAQIMIIALRGTITSSKGEEQAKAALIEPSIKRLLKQYEDAAIKVERATATTDVAGASAEGAQLRFAVDGQPGATDIYWLVINQRLVQIFFIRPEKTASKATICWDLIRNSLRIEKPPAKSQDHR